MSLELGELKDALTMLRDFLNDASMKTAVGALKCPLPPISELICALVNIIRQLKEPLQTIRDNLNYVTDLHDLLENIESLLNTAKALLPSQKDTIEDALSIVHTLKNVPTAAEIDEILQIIDNDREPKGLIQILSASPYA